MEQTARAKKEARANKTDNSLPKMFIPYHVPDVANPCRLKIHGAKLTPTKRL